MQALRLPVAVLAWYQQWILRLLSVDGRGRRWASCALIPLPFILVVQAVIAALIEACEEGHGASISALVEASALIRPGASRRRRSWHGLPGMERACICSLKLDHASFCGLMLDRLSGCDASYVTTVFVAAASWDAVACMGELARRGADPRTAVAPYGATPLIAACGTGSARAAAWLLERGAPVDAATRRGGETALMVACSRGHIECAQLLLRHGACTDITDSREQSVRACSRDLPRQNQLRRSAP